MDTDPKWGRRFMEIAAKVGGEWGIGDGAVLVDEGNALIAVGWYSLPRGMRESEEREADSTFMAEHGIGAVERSLLAARHGFGVTPHTLYYWPGALDMDDARLVIESGIKYVCITPIAEQTALDSFKPVRAILKEAGVKVEIIPL